MGSGRLERVAVEVAASGWWVFPVVPGGKVPWVKGWEGVASRDPARIGGWWRERPFNVGVAVGRSDLVVVDLDERPGEVAPVEWTGARGGRDVLARLAKRAGQPYPGATYTVRTPSGGLHLYFRAPAGARLRNTAGTLGWRIDTRAHGGFVVAAGSARDGGYYRAMNRASVAALPDWLVEALTRPTSPAAVPPAPVRLSGRGVDAYLRAAIVGETERVAGAAPGTRHHTLLGAARRLGQLVAGGGLVEQLARSALRAAAAGYVGVAGYTAAQVERDISDGLAFGAGRPRRIDRT